MSIEVSTFSGNMYEGLCYAKTFGLPLSGIMNIGANEGQECSLYQALGAKHVVLVEPIPEVFEKLRNNVSEYENFCAVEAVCAEKPGEKVSFNVSSNQGESSSVLSFSKHKDYYPHINMTKTIELVTSTVDDIAAQFPAVHFDALVLDVQGFELNVLKGATNTLKGASVVFSEVSEVPLYENACTIIDLMQFLHPLGFGIRWAKLNGHQYGDALFIRQN